MGRPGPGPGDPGPAASFVVPGDPKAAPGSPAYEYGSQIADLENHSVVGILARILMQLQDRRGHITTLDECTCKKQLSPGNLHFAGSDVDPLLPYERPWGAYKNLHIM